jgi:hypothetical protein
MRKNLFWLSDEQWERIGPHLPRDVRGVERADDRRVISGIVHVLKTGCRGAIARPNTVLPRPSITDLFVGRGAAFGKTFSASLLATDDPPKRR